MSATWAPQMMRRNCECMISRSAHQRIFSASSTHSIQCQRVDRSHDGENRFLFRFPLIIDQSIDCDDSGAISEITDDSNLHFVWGIHPQLCYIRCCLENNMKPKWHERKRIWVFREARKSVKVNFDSLKVWSLYEYLLKIHGMASGQAELISDASHPAFKQALCPSRSGHSFVAEGLTHGLRWRR